MSKKATQFRFDSTNQNANGLISNPEASPRSRKGSGNVKVAANKKKLTTGLQSGKSEIREKGVVLTLPLRTKSEANCFEPWRLKHARHKAQQRAVALALNPLRDKIKLPCKILLTRFAPKKLDKHDNLPMSFKYIVDAVCSIITGNFVSGKADSDERISIAYDQAETKEYGITIEIEF